MKLSTPPTVSLLSYSILSNGAWSCRPLIQVNLPESLSIRICSAIRAPAKANVFKMLSVDHSEFGTKRIHVCLCVCSVSVQFKREVCVCVTKTNRKQFLYISVPFTYTSGFQVFTDKWKFHTTFMFPPQFCTHLHALMRHQCVTVYLLVGRSWAFSTAAKVSSYSQNSQLDNWNTKDYSVPCCSPSEYTKPYLRESANGRTQCEISCLRAEPLVQSRNGSGTSYLHLLLAYIHNNCNEPKLEGYGKASDFLRTFL